MEQSSEQKGGYQVGRGRLNSNAPNLIILVFILNESTLVLCNSNKSYTHEK